MKNKNLFSEKIVNEPDHTAKTNNNNNNNNKNKNSKNNLDYRRASAAESVSSYSSNINHSTSIEFPNDRSGKWKKRNSFDASLSQFDCSRYGCTNKIFDLDDKPISYGTNGEPNSHSGCSVSDIIGSFGWFQFVVLLFSGLREGAVGYDALVMSIILQPEENFYCADKLESGFNLSSYNNISSQFNETTQCYRSVNGKMLIDELGAPIRCSSWAFPHIPYGASLVAEWSLVCDQHWLVAFIESAYFFGLVTGNLVWGYYADKLGRRKAYLIAHSVALISGWASVFAPNIQLFAISRYFSAFGSIGYNIIYSIQVELIGTKHRSFSTSLNHLGWGLGVICVPLMDHIFHDYRYIIAVAPVMTTIMLPWALWLPESSRWLMANDDFPKAREELIRAAKFNGKIVSPSLEKRISLLREKIRNDKMKREANNDSKHSYQILFANPILVRDTIILAYVSFTGHLFYYLLTINFGYMKNLSVEANFISSGAGEWVSVVAGALLLKFFSRKTCMSFYLLLMACSFAFQCLLDSHMVPTLENRLIETTNNAVGTLSALLLVFVALIVNQEIYPTVIRQTGSSIVNTLGESGSTLAPFLIQLGRFVGPWKADMFYSGACVMAIIGVQMLTKTDDIELPDN